MVFLSAILTATKQFISSIRVWKLLRRWEMKSAQSHNQNCLAISAWLKNIKMCDLGKKFYIEITLWKIVLVILIHVGSTLPREDNWVATYWEVTIWLRKSTLLNLTERNANHIIPSYCHLPVSCISLVNRCGSIGSYKSQI